MCSQCGHRSARRYDKRLCRTRDLSVAGWRLHVEFERWRIDCPGCGGVHAERLDWLAKNPRYTERFALHVSDLKRGRPTWFGERWKQSLRWQRLAPYEKFAQMIERHWGGIATYRKPQNKVSLGLVEGLNNKIRVIQRSVYGYRDEDCLRLKIIASFLPPLPENAKLQPH